MNVVAVSKYIKISFVQFYSNLWRWKSIYSPGQINKRFKIDRILSKSSDNGSNIRYFSHLHATIIPEICPNGCFWSFVFAIETRVCNYYTFECHAKAMKLVCLCARVFFNFSKENNNLECMTLFNRLIWWNSKEEEKTNLCVIHYQKHHNIIFNNSD